MPYWFYDLSLYEFALAFWRIVINLFFREIRPRGAFHIPRTGPVLFVGAPHHNQFLDPLLLSSEVLKETGRHVAFLTAAKSMQRAIIGTAARAMESIPVSRAADLAITGLGKVNLHPTDDCIVLGLGGTKFTEQFKPNSTIQFGKALGFASAAVESIVSDSELRLKKELHIAGKDERTSVPGSSKIRLAMNASGGEGLAYKALPHIDQHEMYGAVYRRLKDGDCVGIFPEGGSHDRTELLPLKIGVTIMALGAMSSDPSLKVQIVPVGLSYFHPHKFRSRAVVEFGAPISVPRELVDEFGLGGKEKREACGKLLEIIYDGLKTVTLRAPDYETLMVIQAGRRLYKTPGQYLTLGQTVELNKRFIEGYLHYQNEPKVIQLRENIIRYNRRLRDLGLRDHQVDRATRSGVRSLALLVYRLALLLAWSVLALPGVILHAPIFIPAKIISHRKAKEALAASTVKIAARDVLATWKVLVSLAATPVLYLFYAILATYLAYRWDAPSGVRHWMPVYVFLGLPFGAMSALKFGEAAMDVLKSLRPLFINLIPGNEIEIKRLRRMRTALSEELSGVINEFGPQLYEDFNESRIHPSAVVPPSSTSSSTGPGGLDSQNIFSHPMNWLDERLFGWSRVSKPRWKTARSDAGTGTSVNATPYDSGEESMTDDDQDYDQVIGILHHHASASAGKPMSPKRQRARSIAGKQTSYADLQMSRKTQASAGDGPTDGTAQLRERRARKESLEGGVQADERDAPVQESPDKTSDELREVDVSAGSTSSGVRRHGSSARED